MLMFSALFQVIFLQQPMPLNEGFNKGLSATNLQDFSG